jgi:isocitrate dehydrogenase (NAD+)
VTEKALGHLKSARPAAARPEARSFRHTVVLVPGDGIGEELADLTVRVVEASGASVGWERCVAGQKALARFGTTLPPALLEAVARHRTALVGRLGAPAGGSTAPAIELRKAFGVFASVRPAATLRGLATRYPEVDLVIVRENTEDIYAGIEHEVVPGVVESLRVVTEAASTRIARFAFELARGRARRALTCVHKANIMKQSDGLFLRSCRAVAGEFPDIAYQEMIADNAAMQLVRDPSRFDVVLTGNLFGDILSDLCAGILGGPGTVPSIGHGEGVVLVEAVHGHAPHLEGQDLASPLTLLVPAVALLRHLGESEAADRILKGIAGALDAGKGTPDLGGSSRTSEMAQAIMDVMRSPESR